MPHKFNRKDVAINVAAITGLTNAQANNAVIAVLETLSNYLVVSGDAVSLRGFGRFEVRTRKAREYRDPTQHDRKIKRPAVSYIHFKGTDNDPNR